MALAAVVATLAAGVLVAEPAAAAGTSTGTVTGHVVTTDGSPAAAVPIRLSTRVIRDYPEDPGDVAHVHTYTAATDASGDYTVTDAQQGLYGVTVAPSSVWSLAGYETNVTVVAGTTTATTVTAARMATIHGTVVGSENGAPVSGVDLDARAFSPPYAQPPSNDSRVLSAGDGGFTLHMPPGSLQLLVTATDRFMIRRILSVREGEDLDLGTIAVTPSGEVTTSILGRSGHRIQETSQSAVVDGCRLRSGLASTCPSVEVVASGMTRLQLSPGTHTLRYEVTNPLNRVVRHVTRTVVVRKGDRTTLKPVVVRADASSPGKVAAGTYRKGHAAVVRVAAPGYTDGTRPHLRTTFLVGGRTVTPTSVRWRRFPDGSTKDLLATLPKRWSSRTKLSVRAVFHSTDDYAAVTTGASTLTRAR